MKYLFCLLFLSFAATAQTDNQYNLIPFPARFAGQDGRFTLSAATRIVTAPAADAAVRAIAQTLTGQLKTAGSPALTVAPTSPALAKGAHIFLTINKKLALGDEGYKLSVAPGKVTAEAATPKGLFYAAQTIRQLASGSSLPACQITDKPRFGYRGLMLDAGRHFMPVPFVKKFIDLMAMHKQNTFHWHLTDDQGWRIEIKKYPRLTQVGSKRAETLVGAIQPELPDAVRRKAPWRVLHAGSDSRCGSVCPEPVRHDCAGNRDARPRAGGSGGLSRTGLRTGQRLCGLHALGRLRGCVLPDRKNVYVPAGCAD